MAADVTVLAPHRLNFENHRKLAEELAKRHQLNIETGFISYVGLQKFLPIIDWQEWEDVYDIPFYLLHKTVINPKNEHVKLLLDDFMYRWLYEALGDKAGDFIEFKKHWTDDSKKNNEIIERFVKDGYFASFYLKDEDYEIAIYKESIAPSTNHDLMGYTRWSRFVDLIFNQHENESDLKENIIDYIIENRKIIKKHGGNRAYYLCCPSPILKGIGEMAEQDMNWRDIENTINERVGETGVINLRKALFLGEYRNSIAQKYKDRLSYKVHALLDDFEEF